ncbi:MAG: ATP-dependent RecD-like DNA helicase [Clostridiales bacterium]|nr:ATP-dependent RecD-like DNA helicase [Clostridiales bacterium]
MNLEQQAAPLQLEGVVNKIIYRNEESAYLVMAVETAEGEEVVVGYSAGIAVGESIQAQGSYTTHASYGRQFAAASITSIPPSGEAAVRAYLAGGAVKGIGQVLADRIVERFGGEALEILAQQPARLAEVRGITPAKAAQLGRRFEQVSGMRRVLAELDGLALPPYVAVKLFKRYGTQAAEAVAANPYLLCADEYEMHFELVDAAALERFHIDPQSPHRVMAGILYILHHNLGNGHTFLPLEALVERACDFLEVGDDLVLHSVDRLQEAGEVVEWPVANLDGLFLARFHGAEATIADRLLSMATQRRAAQNVPALVEKIEQDLGIRYAEAQRRAISGCAENGVFILTGGPGTGKTTALRGILQLFEKMALETLLAAPTGRAAKRMSELSGAPASTIHRMLGISLRGGQPHCKFNEDNPLAADVVIVDEASMLEVTLFEALLRAMKPSARLILVGDANQLPPVGAGNILRDLLGSDLFASATLTEIFRQSRDSLIVVNAHQINHGEYPTFNARDNDFFLVKCADRGQAPAMAAELVGSRLPRAYGLDPLDDIQVITPTRKTEAGTAALNAALQKALNPPAPNKAEHRFMGSLFRVGDKVMQVRNNYELPVVLVETGELTAGLFNGDMGRIVDIDELNDSMTIRFEDRQVEYPFDCLHQLELAYAVTVHKSQGNEYPLVVFMAFQGMGRLQTRNLLYTAVTRARRIFVALGEEAALCQMTDNSREDRRFSALKYFLLERVRRAGTEVE